MVKNSNLPLGKERRFQFSRERNKIRGGHLEVVKSRRQRTHFVSKAMHIEQGGSQGASSSDGVAEKFAIA